MRKVTIVTSLFVLTLILYIDRVCISAAKVPIATDLGLSDKSMGLVFGAFAISYALSQIPAGWLADRFGPRVLLAGAVAAWSLLTALTGASTGLLSLLVIRFLFGIGEAGAFPGAARVFYLRLNPGERGVANGILMSGSRLGAALAFPLLPWMLETWSWRVSFVVLGGVGVVWAIYWVIAFREPHRSVVVAPEASATPPASLWHTLRAPRLLLAMGQYFASNFTFFLALSWMLPHLQQRFSLEPRQAGVLAMVPLLFATGAHWFTGWLVDRLHRSTWRAWSRRLPAMVGFSLSVVGLLSAAFALTPAGVVAGFTLAVFGTDMTIAPSWTYSVDLGRERSGAVSGAMNMVGNLGAFISAAAFPYLLAWTGTPAAYFVVAAALNGGAVACWWQMRPPTDTADTAPLVTRTNEPAAGPGTDEPLAVPSRHTGIKAS
jgi:ACS family glucarate transporter-like MFS transporter